MSIQGIELDSSEIREAEACQGKMNTKTENTLSGQEVDLSSVLLYNQFHLFYVERYFTSI